MQEPPADVRVDEGVKEMLDSAVALDGAARILVQYYLASAAEQASEEAKPWIQGAVDAGADMALEVRVIRFVDGGLDRSSDEAAAARELLKSKIERLEIFASLAASHAADLREKHGLLTDEADDVESDENDLNPRAM